MSDCSDRVVRLRHRSRRIRCIECIESQRPFYNAVLSVGFGKEITLVCACRQITCLALFRWNPLLAYDIMAPHSQVILCFAFSKILSLFRA